MWESICLTLAATAGNNIGKVLQKKGTLILPPLSFKLKACIFYPLSFSFFSLPPLVFFLFHFITFVLLNNLTTNTIYYLFFNFQDRGKNSSPEFGILLLFQFQELIFMLTSACMLLWFLIPIVNLSVFDSGFMGFLSILCLLESVQPNYACEGSGLLRIFIDFMCVTSQVIRAYAANKAWIIGFLIDICGALLMLRALSQAPVSEFICVPDFF